MPCCAGSMFETGKRWRVPYLLYLLVAIMLAEIAFNGDCPAHTSWGVVGRSHSCPPSMVLSPRWPEPYTHSLSRRHKPLNRRHEHMQRAKHPLSKAWVHALGWGEVEALHAGYATWFVEQQRPLCAPTHRLWNPQDIGRVNSGPHTYCCACCPGMRLIA